MEPISRSVSIAFQLQLKERRTDRPLPSRSVLLISRPGAPESAYAGLDMEDVEEGMQNSLELAITADAKRTSRLTT
jgi:hypothetical protein